MKFNQKYYNYSIKTKYFIGTSGWSYQHWEEIFYPKDLAPNKWLSFYSKHFNTVELNMSFYRTPFPNMIKSWIKNTPNDFIFSIKVSRFITHVKKLIDIDLSIKKLYQLADNFQNKCKCILFQFPPSFHVDENNINKIKKLLID